MISWKRADEGLIRTVARTAIEQKREINFTLWTIEQFPSPGEQKLCRKIFLEEIDRAAKASGELSM